MESEEGYRVSQLPYATQDLMLNQKLAWSDFIGAVDAFYEKLKVSAHGNGKSKSWYDQKSSERKTDELLQYVHQSRNVGHHGSEPISDLHDVTEWYGEVDYLGMTEYEDGTTRARIFGSPDSSIAFHHIKLLPVTNRGKCYPVPSKHLGINIENAKPIYLMRTVLAYCEITFREAVDLLTPPPHSPTPAAAPDNSR